MDEEMEMEEEIVQVYDVVEVDFDYEFDAARFFDFTRPESETESRLSESWFHDAPNYPPSPFVAQLYPLNGLNSPNVDASPKSRYEERLSMDDADDDVDNGRHKEHYDRAEAYRGPSRGLTFFNHLAHDNKKTKAQTLAKPYMRKSSTLMKPTASQLAKQNQQRQVNGSRLQKNEGNSGVCGIENQASKRQKLDGGLLHRIVDMKQPVNLTHKLPRKDAALQGMNPQTKLRITIPREPDLATAHRAERTRSTSTKNMDNSTANTCRFKAQRLNRKTLEAPVLPFSRRTTQHLPDLKAPHLKTTGREKQHNSAAASTSVCQADKASHLKTTGREKQHNSTAASTSVCQANKGLNKVIADRTLETGNRDGKGSGSLDASNLAVVHTFKARPLDRKILTSRGDIGVFRNNKRDVTVPKEFEFQTAKRTQQNLPTELFSKLSLAGEPQPKNCEQVCSFKGSKENRWKSCQQFHQNVKESVALIVERGV
ncbi:protein TPX2 isoform X2 [Beta vulgaris subsp. vulgaris]|uniref:protein TPX2 isoform X2 n=1 Tax=Beta vulgaris subsp. vulgaris TaxID=3555 RepID=UPI0020376784|nr:protein TPX2 isoform X2 [Beta vulgaris subsp. vulgaris]